MSKILETAKHAVNAFGLENGNYFDNYPFHKFNFAVKINMNSGDAEKLTLAVKNVQMPNVNLNTEIVNEYNRKRILYTGVDYGECVLTLHDVADGKVLNFWKEYFKYYFADSRSAGYGFDTALIQDENRRYKIDTIEIFQMQGGKGNLTTLYKPMITSFNAGNMDYFDSSGIAEISISVKPEYIRYKTGSASFPGNVQSFLDAGTPRTDSANFGAQGGSSRQFTTQRSIDDYDGYEDGGNDLTPAYARSGRNGIDLNAATRNTLSSGLTESSTASILRLQRENADKFGVSATVEIERLPTSSSALDSIGGLGKKESVLPAAPISSKGKTQPGKKPASATPSLGSVNISNAQGGKK